MLQFFLKNKRIFFLVSLLFIALTLFARDIQGKKQYSIIDKLLIALFTPPLRITSLGFQYINRLCSNYVYLVDLHKENSVLKEHIKKLEIDNQLLQEQANENKRLRDLLSFKKKFEYKMLPAEIIGRDPSSWFKTILIDKGKDDGVTKEAGVITPDGVVGKIIDVGKASSKVLLLTDINSYVDAFVKRSRARGIVVGYSEDLCTLNYVLKTEELVLGDSIVSSGINDVYPKGILIGTVTGINKDKSGFFQLVEVRPSVDFTKLNEVLIVLKENESGVDNGS